MCNKHSFSTPGMRLVGARLSEPHTSGTACICVCVCLFACLQSYTKWAQYLTKIKVVHSVSLGRRASGLASATWNKGNWSWSTHRNLLLVCAAVDHQRHVAHGQYKFNMDDSGWGCLRCEGPYINSTHKHQKPSPWFQCKAYLCRWGLTYLCIIKFSLLRSCNSRQWQILLCTMTN